MTNIPVVTENGHLGMKMVVKIAKEPTKTVCCKVNIPYGIPMAKCFIAANIKMALK